MKFQYPSMRVVDGCLVGYDPAGADLVFQYPSMRVVDGCAQNERVPGPAHHVSVPFDAGRGLMHPMAWSNK